MIPGNLWQEIESRQFSVMLGVVSTPRAFDEALKQQPAVTALAKCLISPADIDSLEQRALALLQIPSNPRYCHPNDLAIAVYLRLLDIYAPDAASQPAKSALTLPNLWWARAMAMRIAASPNRTIPSTRVELVAVTENGFARQSRRTNASISLPPPELVARSRFIGKVITTANSTAGANMAQVNTSPMRVTRDSRMAA